MKIKTTLPAFFGQKIKLPIDGLVELDENGEVEASTEAAELLLQSKDWKSAEEDEETEEVEATLEQLTIPQLIAICKEAQFPETEWKKYHKSQKGLVVYITKKQEEAK